MDERSHKDKMDQFFDQNWDDAKLSQDMGVPDLEDSWGAIKDGIPRTNKRRWFWLLLLIPFIVGTGIWFSEYSSSAQFKMVEEPSRAQNDSHNLESEVSVANESDEVSFGEVSKKDDEDVRTGTLDSKSASSRGQGSDAVKTNIREEFFPAGNSGAKEPSNVTTNIKSRPNLASEAAAESNGGFVTGEESSSTKGVLFPSQKEAALSPAVEKRRIKTPMPLEIAQGPLQEKIGAAPMIPKQPEMAERSQWSLEPSIGTGRHLFILRNNVAEIEGIDVSIEDGQFYEAQLRGAWQYKAHRRVVIGLGWRQHSFTSHYELGVNYTESGEIQDGQGNWHQGYSHTLPTLFGDAPMEHILIRGENDGLNEGEVIPFALFLRHEVREFNLSAGHHWDFPVGSWQISLGGRLMGGYWYEKNEIRELDLVSHHAKVHHNRTHYHTRQVDLERPWHLSGVAEIGVQRNIFSGQKIGVRTAFQHAFVTPVLDRSVAFNPEYMSMSLFWRVQI